MRHMTCITLALFAGGLLTAIDIPRGTDIPVTLDEDIEIASEQVGRSFEAHVSRDVVVDGKVAIAEGAAATVRLQESEEGADRVTLRLSQVTIDRELRSVSTEDARAETEKDKAGAAEKTGIGAAAGAVVGAVTGAGVIEGAIVGAGGGLAWGLASGRDLEVGEGTRLYFSLAEDVETE